MSNQELKYTGYIVESSDNHIIAGFNETNNIYFALNKRLYQCNRKYLTEILYVGENFDFLFTSDGVWIHVGNRGGTSSFYDLKTKEVKYNKIKEWIGMSTFTIGNIVIGTSRRINDRYIFTLNTINWDLHKKEGKFSFVTTDQQCIYAREITSGFFCFDIGLNEYWHHDLGGLNYSKASNNPMFDGGLVIINHNNDILAFNKRTGEPVWKYHLEHSPGSFYVINGKVYLTDIANIIILNAQTGNVLIKKTSGYNENTAGEQTELGVFPVGNYLYVFASKCPIVRFLNQDATKCLQELELNSTGYGIGEIRNPLIYNDVILQRIGNGRSLSANGYLMLYPAKENESLEIVKQPRLPTRIYAVPSLREEHIQRIYVEGDRIDDVIRFAGIVIKELNYETGITPVFNLKKWSLDRKHNGIIELVVDPEPFHKSTLNELESLIDELNRLFSDFPSFSGSGKSPIKVSLLLKKRIDWDESGDLIDLEDLQLQNNKKPIS